MTPEEKKRDLNSIEYWQGCLSRVEADDIFSQFMLQGKIKSLYRQQKLTNQPDCGRVKE